MAHTLVSLNLSQVNLKVPPHTCCGLASDSILSLYRHLICCHLFASGTTNKKWATSLAGVFVLCFSFQRKNFATELLPATELCVCTHVCTKWKWRRVHARGLIQTDYNHTNRMKNGIFVTSPFQQSTESNDMRREKSATNARQCQFASNS